MFKSAYLNKVYDDVAKRSPGEEEFLQAVKEVLESLEPVIEANPKYEANGILERIVEPERQIFFRVSWVDDNGKVQVTAATEFSSTLLSVPIRAAYVLLRMLQLLL